MSTRVETPLPRRIRDSVIGADQVVQGPYGPRRVTYADHTAAGRAPGFLEDFIRCEVLPRYAGTDTGSAGAGGRTARLREDARAIVRDAVGGGAVAYVEPAGPRHRTDPVLRAEGATCTPAASPSRCPGAP